MKYIGEVVCGDDGSLTLAEYFTSDEEECHNHCRANSECEWFTVFPNKVSCVIKKQGCEAT